MAVIAVGLGFGLGACTSTESVELADVGLEIGVDIQAGEEIEIVVPADPDTAVAIASVPNGVTASFSGGAEGSRVLSVVVDPDTPGGAYVLALLVTRGGEEHELIWPFDVVQHDAAADSRVDVAVSTTRPESEPPVPTQTLDLSGVRWVTIGPDGLRTDDGTEIWMGGSLFDKAVARDRSGGLVFVNGDELWWYRAGEAEPVLVASGVPSRVVEVVTDPAGPTARLGYGDWRHVSLAEGRSVGDPGGAMVQVDSGGRETWSAANGWFVSVSGPDLVDAEEGTPTVVATPARLILGDATGAVLVDVVVGTDDEPWIRVHDFDGRTLIVSRGPIEPAMADESFFVVDFGCERCTERFVAAGSSASLVGPDADWNGPVQFTGSAFDAFDPQQ